MANEFKHKDPCTSLTQAEYISACGDGHIFACQATGDIAYASSATVLSKLGKGAAGTILNMGGSCIPAWTATPTIGSTSWCNAGHAHAASNSGGTVCANVLAGTTLKSCVVTSSLTTVGALNSGSIACGFGAIDNGSSAITTTGLISGGSLDIDNVLINGTTIGHTCDTDLITVADQSVTIAGDLAISGGCITLTGAATDIDLIDNNACALSFDASGQAGILAIDTQNCAEGVKMSGKLTVTGAISSTGALTVGVDDTGHDVKFFGAAAGAYMLYDQSCDQLEIRGASADATTSTGKLLLSTSLTNVNANDVIGSINFQAPVEAGGTDAITIAAGIRAVAQATFTCAVNATDLIFYTGHSEAATEKFRFTSQGEIGIGGANYGNDGQVLTSTGGGTAVAWECASGGGTTINNATANELVTVGACTSELCAEAGLTYDGTTLKILKSGQAALSIESYSTTASHYASLSLGHSDHGTVGTVSDAIEACDVLGRIDFKGSNTSALVTGGTVEATATQTWSGSARGTKLEFRTTNCNSTSANVRLTLNPNGELVPAAAIYAADGSAGNPGYAFKCSTGIGFFHAGSNKLAVGVGGSERARFSCAEFYIAECANGQMSRGITINQTDADNEILALKSSDVSHGITCSGNGAETDTYFYIRKTNAAGGAVLKAFQDCGASSSTMRFEAFQKATADTCDTGSSSGVMYWQAMQASGDASANIADAGNAFTWHMRSSTRMLMKGDGDLHLTNTSLTALDDYPDALMGRVGRVGISPDESCLRKTCGHLLQERPDLLQVLKDKRILIGEPCDPNLPNGFINVQRGITFGWDIGYQNWQQLTSQEKRIEELETQLKALSEGK